MTANCVESTDLHLKVVVIKSGVLKCIHMFQVWTIYVCLFTCIVFLGKSYTRSCTVYWYNAFNKSYAKDVLIICLAGLAKRYMVLVKWYRVIEEVCGSLCSTIFFYIYCITLQARNNRLETFYSWSSMSPLHALKSSAISSRHGQLNSEYI